VPPAFRRDTSTLRVRINDGASAYRPAHERNARVAQSPEAVREEPHPGPGDSARTRSRAERAAVADQERGEGDFVEAAPLRTPGDDEVRSQGPLDTETGPRRYDVSLRGPARDNAWSRAASDEKQPSVMDLSAAAVAGSGREGRGPGVAPGALPRASDGQAPSRSGLAASILGPGSDGAGEGVQDHYYFDLDRRVTAAVRFPKQLALELRQGDAIVTFTVAPNGRVVGPIQVAKSAGFPAFDDEAVAAVQRAAPFSPPGKTRPISLRVWFRNPMVR
jgi:TonB family protein